MQLCIMTAKGAIQKCQFYNMYLFGHAKQNFILSPY